MLKEKLLIQKQINEDVRCLILKDFEKISKENNLIYNSSMGSISFSNKEHTFYLFEICDDLSKLESLNKENIEKFYNKRKSDTLFDKNEEAYNCYIIREKIAIAIVDNLLIFMEDNKIKNTSNNYKYKGFIKKYNDFLLEKFNI